MTTAIKNLLGRICQDRKRISELEEEVMGLRKRIWAIENPPKYKGIPVTLLQSSDNRPYKALNPLLKEGRWVHPYHLYWTYTIVSEDLSVLYDNVMESQLEPAVDE